MEIMEDNIVIYEGDKPITYSRVNPERRWGRLYSEEPSLQTMSKSRRGETLSRKHIYMEIDVVNCYPTIFVELCRKMSIDPTMYKNWTEYCDNRDDYYESGSLKRVFIDALFGHSHLVENKLPRPYFDMVARKLEWMAERRKKRQTEFVNQLILEAKEIKKLFWDLPEFEEERKWAIREHDSKLVEQNSFIVDNEYTIPPLFQKNEINRFIHLVFTRIEDRALKAMYDAYQSRVLCLLFDGILVEKTHHWFYYDKFDYLKLKGGLCDFFNNDIVMNILSYLYVKEYVDDIIYMKTSLNLKVNVKTNRFIVPLRIVGGLAWPVNIYM